MPATSQAQRTAMAIAEHAPGKLYARNKAMLGMTKSQLHDFAATKSKGLPKRKAPVPRGTKAAGQTGKLSAMLRAKG